MKPVMLELGAYWGHYSMWLRKARSEATTILVEGDPANLETAKYNFGINGYANAKFIHDFVGKGRFEIDSFMSNEGIHHLDILHADIQGYEVEMLKGAQRALENRLVSYFLISTHSEELHKTVEMLLLGSGYNVEVSSGFQTHTTSCDGFVLATAPEAKNLFDNFTPLGRLDIVAADSHTLIESAMSSETAIL